MFLVLFLVFGMGIMKPQKLPKTDVFLLLMFGKMLEQVAHIAQIVGVAFRQKSG